jgi:hypothetical protein
MGLGAGRAAVEALANGHSTFISLGKDGTPTALPLIPADQGALP